MECPSCNALIADDATNCQACGWIVQESCPSCGTLNSRRAKFCSECGKALHLAGGISETTPLSASLSAEYPGVTAERRQLTVMFCDIVGSTELASRLDPEDHRAVIGPIRRRVAEIVSEFHGYVAEYLGDGTVVYFGFPEAREDYVECAIRAGLSVASQVSQLRLLNDYRPNVRIGIATGLVVVGNAKDKGDPDVLIAAGVIPTLAARLQSIAEPGAVVVASTTRRIAAGLFEYRDLGLQSLKGFPEPVQVWQVLGSTATESRFDAQHPSALTPLIGRQKEITFLQDKWRHATEGKGSVVLVSGESGIGKSRLTAKLLEQMASEQHTKLRYFCSPHLQGSALHPSIQQLERAAGFSRADSSTQKLDRLARLFAPGPQMPEDIALMADLLSIPLDDRYPKLQYSAQKRKEKTMEAFLRQLDLLSQQNPLLMVFEDAHWIDPTSRELLFLAVERIANLPILLVVTFRPEFNVAWASQQHVSILELVPLARHESVELIASIPGGAELPKEVVDDIVDRTDGVPLYVEELTNAVLEGVLQDEGGHLVVTRSPRRALSIPATLHASLMARLDRLGQAKEIAQIGAAIGREFSFDLLSAVAQKDPGDLQIALDRLVRSGLLFASRSSPQVNYLFKHALVQDAAYDTMLRTTRQNLHTRVAETLEQIFVETKDVQPELLAHHCTEAGLIDKAISYWLKAGQRALARSTMQEAITRLERGLQLLESLPESASRHGTELAFQIARGMALIATKGYAVQVTGDAFARGRQLCDLLNQPPQLLAVLHGQWTHDLLRADLVSARQRAAELLQQGELRGDALWTLMGCRFSGVTCYPLGEFAAGRNHLERGLALFDPARRATYAALTVDDAQVVMLTYLAYIHLYLGDANQARARCGSALEEARRLAQPYSLTHALIGTAYIELFLGFPQSALTFLSELMAIATEYRIAYYSAVGTIFRGVCLRALGELGESVAVLTQGLNAYRATGSGLYLPSFVMFLAEAQGQAGNPDEGLKLIAEASALMESTQTRNDEAELSRVNGCLLLAVDDRSAAEASFRRAIALANRQGSKILSLRAALDLAGIMLDRDELCGARDMFLPIYNRITEGFDTPVMKRATIVAQTVS